MINQFKLNLNPYRVQGAMFAEFHKLNAKPQTASDLNSALQVIWDSLPEETTQIYYGLSKATQCLPESNDGHFDHVLK